MSESVVIVNGARTAMGGFQGSLSSVTAPELGAVVIREAVQRAGLQPQDIQEVIMGCVLPAGLKQGPARQAMRKAGLPDATGAVTITATVGAISGTTRLTVTAATLMSITVMPSTATITMGGTQKFTALAMFDDGLMLDVTASVTWESDDDTRVAIDPTGLATATGAAGDTATISATIGAVSGTATVTVS